MQKWVKNKINIEGNVLLIKSPLLKSKKKQSIIQIHLNNLQIRYSDVTSFQHTALRTKLSQKLRKTEVLHET